MWPANLHCVPSPQKPFASGKAGGMFRSDTARRQTASEAELRSIAPRHIVENAGTRTCRRARPGPLLEAVFKRFAAPIHVMVSVADQLRSGLENLTSTRPCGATARQKCRPSHPDRRCVVECTGDKSDPACQCSGDGHAAFVDGDCQPFIIPCHRRRPTRNRSSSRSRWDAPRSVIASVWCRHKAQQ